MSSRVNHPLGIDWHGPTAKATIPPSRGADYRRRGVPCARKGGREEKEAEAWCQNAFYSDGGAAQD